MVCNGQIADRVSKVYFILFVCLFVFVSFVQICTVR